MNVEFKVLDNGLTIVNDKMNINSTSIGVWIGSGSAKETENESGIAHMLEHMAFKGGLRGRPEPGVCLCSS